MIRFRDSYWNKGKRKKKGSAPMSDIFSEVQTAESQAEGKIARAIEKQTAKLPSDRWLWAASGALLGSAVLQMMDRKHESLFIGQLAPIFLILGLYNKIVKVAGSDRSSVEY